VRAACASDACAADGTAAHTLGNHFEFGLGVSRSLSTAFEWFSRSAEREHADALATVGMRLLLGFGVVRDAAAGRAMRERALACSSFDYKLRMGRAFLHGVNGAPKDPKRAFSLLTAAVNDPSAQSAHHVADLAEARMWLAECYRTGQGTTVDYFACISLYELAAQAGEARAFRFVAGAYEHGDGFAKDLRKAFEWHVRAAEATGWAESMRQAGVFLENGFGVDVDTRAAFRWYKRGADAGDAIAAFNAAQFLTTGRDGVAADPAAAIPLLERAAAAGLPQAHLALSDNFRLGRGVAKDDREALQLCRRAVDAGCLPALVTLGMFYEEGVGGVVRDRAEAVRFFKRAAEAGEVKGMEALASAALADSDSDSGAGSSATVDGREAVSWLRRAIRAGSARAHTLLGFCMEEGVGVDPDPRAALDCFRTAIAAGQTEAMHALGVALYEGRGAGRDVRGGAEWICRAAAAGEPQSVELLRRYPALRAAATVVPRAQITAMVRPRAPIVDELD
jgi:TPR repeat protein